MAGQREETAPVPLPQEKGQEFKSQQLTGEQAAEKPMTPRQALQEEVATLISYGKSAFTAENAKRSSEVFVEAYDGLLVALVRAKLRDLGVSEEKSAQMLEKFGNSEGQARPSREEFAKILGSEIGKKAFDAVGEALDLDMLGIMNRISEKYAGKTDVQDMGLEAAFAPLTKMLDAGLAKEVAKMLSIAEYGVLISVGETVGVDYNESYQKIAESGRKKLGQRPSEAEIKWRNEFVLLSLYAKRLEEMNGSEEIPPLLVARGDALRSDIAGVVNRDREYFQFDGKNAPAEESGKKASGKTAKAQATAPPEEVLSPLNENIEKARRLLKDKKIDDDKIAELNGLLNYFMMRLSAGEGGNDVSSLCLDMNRKISDYQNQKAGTAYRKEKKNKIGASMDTTGHLEAYYERKPSQLTLGYRSGEQGAFISKGIRGFGTIDLDETGLSARLFGGWVQVGRNVKLASGGYGFIAAAKLLFAYSQEKGAAKGIRARVASEAPATLLESAAKGDGKKLKPAVNDFLRQFGKQKKEEFAFLGRKLNAAQAAALLVLLRDEEKYGKLLDKDISGRVRLALFGLTGASREAGEMLKSSGESIRAKAREQGSWQKVQAVIERDLFYLAHPSGTKGAIKKMFGGDLFGAKQAEKKQLGEAVGQLAEELLGNEQETYTFRTARLSPVEAAYLALALVYDKDYDANVSKGLREKLRGGLEKLAKGNPAVAKIAEDAENADKFAKRCDELMGKDGKFPAATAEMMDEIRAGLEQDALSGNNSDAVLGILGPEKGKALSQARVLYEYNAVKEAMEKSPSIYVATGGAMKLDGILGSDSKSLSKQMRKELEAYRKNLSNQLAGGKLPAAVAKQAQEKGAEAPQQELQTEESAHVVNPQKVELALSAQYLNNFYGALSEEDRHMFMDMFNRISDEGRDREFPGGVAEFAWLLRGIFDRRYTNFEKAANDPELLPIFFEHAKCVLKIEWWAEAALEAGVDSESVNDEVAQAKADLKVIYKQAARNKATFDPKSYGKIVDKQTGEEKSFAEEMEMRFGTLITNKDQLLEGEEKENSRQQ